MHHKSIFQKYALGSTGLRFAQKKYEALVISEDVCVISRAGSHQDS